MNMNEIFFRRHLLKIIMSNEEGKFWLIFLSDDRSRKMAQGVCECMKLKTLMETNQSLQQSEILIYFLFNFVIFLRKHLKKIKTNWVIFHPINFFVRIFHCNQQQQQRLMMKLIENDSPLYSSFHSFSVSLSFTHAVV